MVVFYSFLMINRILPLPVALSRAPTASAIYNITNSLRPKNTDPFYAVALAITQP